MTPTARFEDVNGLRHNVIVWDGGGDTTVLCLHGFLDMGRSFSATVDALQATRPDLHCVAFDWRGHGETAWTPPGTYYHFADYVRDVVVLARRHARSRLIVVAHSMGAMVASLWLGARPEDAAGLVMLEGLGPPVTTPDGYVKRMRQWLDECAPFDPTPYLRPMRDLDHAQARLQRAEPRIPAARARQLAEWASRARDDGTRVWRYDPMHKTRAPTPTPAEAGMAFWASLTCPVLWLGGAESVWVRPEIMARVDTLPTARRALIPDAGHALHNDQPEAVAAQILGFVAEIEAPDKEIQ